MYLVGKQNRTSMNEVYLTIKAAINRRVVKTKTLARLQNTFQLISRPKIGLPNKDSHFQSNSSGVKMHGYCRKISENVSIVSKITLPKVAKSENVSK